VELLNEVGFDGVTVELVSERSGVARSTLYRHWRTKAEMLRDAFAAQASGRRATGRRGDGLSALTAYAQTVAVGLTDVWAGRRQPRCLGGQRPGAAGGAARVRRRHPRDLREVVELGQRSRGARPDADTAALVDRLLDLVIARSSTASASCTSPSPPPGPRSWPARPGWRSPPTAAGAERRPGGTTGAQPPFCVLLHSQLPRRTPCLQSPLTP
jgi:AcrR family transcriptional regulator